MMTTTVTRWTPFRELDSMERRMRRTLVGLGMAPVLLPAADVYETPEELVVELEVPGYEEKELGLQIVDHTLTVTGVRRELKEHTDRAFHLHERLEHEFERSFTLPAEADMTHVKALFKKGVLEVHMPKLQMETPAKIEITSE